MDTQRDPVLWFAVFRLFPRMSYQPPSLLWKCYYDLLHVLQRNFAISVFESNQKKKIVKPVKVLYYEPLINLIEHSEIIQTAKHSRITLPQLLMAALDGLENILISHAPKKLHETLLECNSLEIK